MKKNNLIKKVILVLLTVSLLMYIMTGRSFADDIINLDSFETIGSENATQTTTDNVISNDINTTNQIITNNQTTNIVNNTVTNSVGTNSSLTNTTAIPEAGSNTEIIFIIGVTVLAGTAIHLNKKSKIK